MAQLCPYASHGCIGELHTLSLQFCRHDGSMVRTFQRLLCQSVAVFMIGSAEQ